MHVEVDCLSVFPLRSNLCSCSLARSTINLSISSSSRDFISRVILYELDKKSSKHNDSHGQIITKGDCIQVADTTRHAPSSENNTISRRLNLLRPVRAAIISFPLKVISPLRGGGDSCSYSCVCGLLGVDEILDRSDLHVIPRRLEHEDENGFIGEWSAARAFTVQLRLYMISCAQRHFESVRVALMHQA